MPESNVVQNAFNAGEISPRVRGRSDLEPYASAAARIENFVVQPAGGLERRPGSRFVFNLGEDARLVPFRFSRSENYILAFGSNRITFYTTEGFIKVPTVSVGNWDSNADKITNVQGGLINGDGPFTYTTTGSPIGGLSAGNSYYIWTPPSVEFGFGAWNILNNNVDYVGHPYPGVALTGGLGPVRITGTGPLPTGLSYNTDYWICRDSADAFGFAASEGGSEIPLSAAPASGAFSVIPTPRCLQDSFHLTATAFSNLPIDLSGGGTGIHTFTRNTDGILSIQTPWSLSDAQELDFAQSADVLYIVHPNYPPYKLTRVGATKWILEKVDLIDGPYQAENSTSVTITPSATAGGVYTATASSGIFSGNDVGKLLRVSTTNVAGVGLWWGYGEIIRVVGTEFDRLDIDFTFITQYEVTGSTFTIAHAFSDGEGPIRVANLTGAGVNSAFSEGTNYWVGVLSSSEYGLAATQADAVARNFITPAAGDFGVDTHTTSVIEVVGHGLSTGIGPVYVNTTDTLPAGLVENQVYYVFGLTPDRFQFVEEDLITPVPIDSVINFRGVATVTGADGSSVGGSATATVLVRRAIPSTVGATTNWQLGLYGGADGFPKAVSFAEQRLALGGSAAAPNRFDLSQSGDLENFAPDDGFRSTREVEAAIGFSGGATVNDRLVTDGSAIRYTLTSSDVNTVEYMAAQRQLICLTNGGVWPVQSSEDLAVLTPSDINAKLISNRGASRVKPVFAENFLIYHSHAQQKIFGAGFDAEAQGIGIEDLTIVAEQITDSTIRQFAFSLEPWQIIWACRNDGQLCSLTINPGQQVRGWARHLLGGNGIVRSVASIPDSTATYDQAWLVVQRVINGATKYYVEYLANRLQTYNSPTDAEYLDSAPEPFVGRTTTYTGSINAISIYELLRTDGGSFVTDGWQAGEFLRVVTDPANEHQGRIYEIASVSASEIRVVAGLDGTQGITGTCTIERVTKVVSGLDHLEGETVTALVDGGAGGSYTVSGGSITLDNYGQHVRVGLDYDSKLETLPFAAGNGDLDFQTLTVSDVGLRFVQTLGGYLERPNGTLQVIAYRTPTMPMGSPPTLYNDILRIQPDRGWSPDWTLKVTAREGLPMNLTKLTMRLRWSTR